MFSEHLPHRVNLLIAFRERFSGQNQEKNLEPKDFRDLFRCAKDISMLMVRFFCSEVGLTVPRDKQEIIKAPTVKGERYGAKRVCLADIKGDPCFAALTKVVIAANRAVAHIEPCNVNHDVTDEELIDVINFVEEKIIISNIYPSEEAFKKAMKLKNNKM